MRQPSGHNWVGEVETDKLVKAPTPPAKSTLLQQADAYPVWAAIAYWPCAYLHENGVSGTPDARHMIEIMPPAQARAQYAFGVVGTDPATPVVYKTIDTRTGSDVTAGAVAARLNIPWVDGRTRTFLPHAGGQLHRLVSSDWDSSAAATNIDRLLNLTTDGAPYVEPVSTQNCVSFTLFSTRLMTDLEAL